MLINNATQLQQLEAHAQKNAHRYLVVFSGKQQWCQAALTNALSSLQHCETIRVTDRAPTEALDQHPACQSIQAKDVKTYLGSEIERVIWDGFSGIHPDALGAASGLIKGGGLLFLMLPDFVSLSSSPDPDYLRMCRQATELPHFGTRFLKRMIHSIQSDSEITTFYESDAEQNNFQLPTGIAAPIALASSAQNAIKLVTQLTADQSTMIDGIKAVAQGHRNRPLVVLADRGRGKSSALGIAAATMVLEHSLTVIITAPHKRACRAAFQHYQQTLGTQVNALTSNFTFFAPDKLLEALPECHLLFVDEAASIPAPMLKRMLKAYSRVVFSSTTHGYEGTGQGFNVRFRHTLDSLTPEWKTLTLKQPVRWAMNDPLERWMFDFLLLNAQIPKLSSDDLIKQKSPKVEWVSQDQLLHDAPLLKQVIALLVTAHYQTSPSDIRMILDDPTLTIGVIRSNTIVMAVVLLLHEGGVNNDELAHNIIQGTRRPRGHLVPQALTACTANPDFLRLQTYRIMRIAVHPSLSRQGLGSKLITASAALCQENNIDYLSASFGFTPLLNAFWDQNSFELLRLGYHKDAASGAQSAIVVRALNNETRQTLHLARAACVQHFIFGLSTLYRSLEVDTTLAALQSFKLPTHVQTNLELGLIQAFADHHRSFEDCAHILFSFSLNHCATGSIKILTNEEQQVICLRVIKGLSVGECVNALNISGKKQLNASLKKAISKLLDAML